MENQIWLRRSLFTTTAVILLASGLAACSSPAPQPTPKLISPITTPSPSVSATPVTTPAPTLAPTPAPTPKPVPKPVPKPTPKPAPKSTPAPAAQEFYNLPAPVIRQDMSLDCESAALAIALAEKGHNVGQGWVFNHLAKQPS